MFCIVFSSLIRSSVIIKCSNFYLLTCILQMQCILMPNIKQIEGILWREYFQAISLCYANNLLVNFSFNILYHNKTLYWNLLSMVFVCQYYTQTSKPQTPKNNSIFIYCLSFIIFDCVWIIPIVTEKPSLEINIMLLCREPEKVELWDIFWNN